MKKIKVADMKALIQSGVHINITPHAVCTKGCQACEFWLNDDGIIWCSSFGPRPDLNVSALASHLKAMLAEGFKLEVYYTKD